MNFIKTKVRKFALSFSVILLTVLLSPNVLLAGEKVDKTIDANEQGTVTIYNVRGDIKVSGWDESKVRVKGTLDDLKEKFIFKKEGNRVEIKIKLPEHSSTRSGKGSNLEIWVPNESKLNFDGVATDLNVNKVKGKLDINSVSGDLNLGDIGDKTYINSVSGDIKLQQNSGKLDISTVSGDAKLLVGEVEIQCSGVSADIEIRANRLLSSKLGTVSGDIEVYGKLGDDATLMMGTVSGDGLFYTDESLNASVSMETAPGGDIINELSGDKADSSFIGSESIEFTLGNGDATIKMSTVSGDIGLKKR